LEPSMSEGMAHEVSKIHNAFRAEIA
jgi:hypothetical protein